MKKKLFVIFILFQISFLIGQTIDTSFIVSFNKNKFGLNKKNQIDADSLVNRLIGPLSGEKEKFDAIFSWVAREIQYDWWDYFSAGSSPKSVNIILQRKAAICLGYATLMDTLCAKAGITNVSVFGYAKDDLFDVQDSIYFDNHAWNAVKLDGKWFVYDVTWSTGSPKYELTKRSKKIYNKRKNFKYKYKKKRIISKRKLKKITKASICGEKPKFDLYVLRWRYFNRLRYKFLTRFRLKTKEVFEKSIKTDFYLAQPEVFAITHMPDDPYWSLCDVNTMIKFENDKAFYYLHDSVYKQQIRSGRDCPECDTWVAMNKKKRAETLKKRSYELNRRNYFIAGECDWNISDISLDEARLAAVDSIKLVYYDSALVSMGSCRRNYQMGSWSASMEARKQKLKNRKKLDLLLIEDAGHIKAFNSRLGISMVDYRKSNQMLSKSSSKRANWLNRVYKIGLTGNRVRILTPKNDISSRINLLNERFEKQRTVADSLKQLIATTKEQFDSVLVGLALNIPYQLNRVDSMEYWFYERSYMRSKLLDNYKKPIVDTTVKIYDFERRYFYQADKILYNPFDTLFVFYNRILDLIRIKNYALDQTVKIKMELVKVAATDLSDLNSYKNELIADGMLDYCWLSNDYGKILMVNKGFSALIGKQKLVLAWISAERWVERRYRYFPVENEWKRRYRKYNGIAKFNKRLAGKKISSIKREKRPVEKREKLRKSKK